MRTALLLSLLALPAAPAGAAEPAAPFAAALEKADTETPEAAFRDAGRLPPDFRAYLEGKGIRAAGTGLREEGEPALTNRQVALLYFDFRNARLREALSPRPGLPGAGRLLAPGASSPDFDGGSGAPDAPPVLPETPPPGGEGEAEKKKGRRRGLRILGIEIGTGSRPEETWNEPFERKGQRDPLDWDIRARLKLEGLGARAHYRNPLPWRSLTVGFLKYWDWPGAIGLEGARKDLYGAFGATPESPQGGFELTLGSQFNAHLGAVASYDHKETLKGERWSDRNVASLSVGYSPLGDNPGKLWNYTLLGSVSYQDLDRDYPDIGYKDSRDGFGYSAGAAFQHALHKLPWKWLGPAPDGNGWVWLDRVKVSSHVSDSGISSLAFTSSLELSVFLTKHVLVTPGVSMTWRPEPEEGDPDEKSFGWGPSLGLDLKDLL